MKYNRYSKPSNSRKHNQESDEINKILPDDTPQGAVDGSIENTEEKEIKDKPSFDFDLVKILPLRELQNYIKKFSNFTSHNLGNKELLLCELMKFLNQQYSLKITGVLEIIQDNYGFLRYIENNYLYSKYDVYVSPQNIQKYSLIIV